MEKRHRINIGTILKNAFQGFLRHKDAVAKSKIDPDWMDRFIDCAKYVSDSDMQLLWSKILSGELNKPNSISVMALETMRNMLKRDAEIFLKLASFTVIDSDGGNPFIPINAPFKRQGYKTDEEYGIKYDELLWMQELRLLNLNIGLSASFDLDDKSKRVETTLCCGNLRIDISSEKDLSIPCYSYTRIGAQLHSLIEDVKPNKDFFEDRIKNRYSSDVTKINIVDQ
nr:DUF2806 domain-containing protein [Prevotella sp. P2-180]